MATKRGTTVALSLDSFHWNRHTLKQTLYFFSRWILLCFKREFPEDDALKMWEACWAHYQTDYFHLFICVAIISVYGEDVVQQDLPADEMLLHFSSLSMHMNAEVILKKVRQVSRGPLSPQKIFSAKLIFGTGKTNDCQIESWNLHSSFPEFKISKSTTQLESQSFSCLRSVFELNIFLEIPAPAAQIRWSISGAHI